MPALRLEQEDARLGLVQPAAASQAPVPAAEVEVIPAWALAQVRLLEPESLQALVLELASALAP